MMWAAHLHDHFATAWTAGFKLTDYFEQALLSNRPRGARILEQSVAAVSETVVVVNRGETKGDKAAAVKIDGGTSEVLAALRAHLLG